MKKLFKYVIPCVAIALSLTSCSDTMDDKAAIDAKYEKLEIPTIAVSSAIAGSYSEAVATGALSAVDNAQEVGFQVSTDESFATYASFVSEEVAAEFTAKLTNLTEKTTYYVRPYVFTKTGQTVCGEATSFTTPGAPYFDIIGTYTAVDYEHSSAVDFDQSGDSYTVTVSYADGSDTEVEIFNLWGGGETLVGVYDAATSTITVPTGQNLYYYDGYGYVTARAVNDNITNYQDNIIFKFTPLGGMMVTGIYQCYLAAASYSFGFIHTSMVHNSENDE